MIIKNVDECSISQKFLVARFSKEDNNWWYWGAFNDEQKAKKIALVIGGSVFLTKDVDCEIRIKKGCLF